MSWSVTINNLDEFGGFDHATVEYMITQHPLYYQDMMLALEVARKAGLKSAALTGMRTVSPYGEDEVVDISVRGMVTGTDFQKSIRDAIAAGPGHQPSAEEVAENRAPEPELYPEEWDYQTEREYVEGSYSGEEH